MTMKNSYIIKADVSELETASVKVSDALLSAGADHKVAYKVRLSLDEILTNVVSYAYDNNEGNIEISYDINESERYIDISVTDEGKAFNPLEEVKEPDFSLDLHERKIGGLGLFIVKNSMDEVKYLRKDNKNILMMKKYY